MSQAKTSILAMPETWNIVAEGYQEVTRPLFQGFSQQAISALSPISTEVALDVACGPGTTTLELAPQVEAVQAIDFSKDMLTALEQNLSEEDISNVEYQEADGQALPFDEEDFDLAFSMFGWMFFPDRAKGLHEFSRVLKDGGRLALSSWLPRSENPLFELVTQTLMHMNPKMQEPPKISNPLELSENFEKELKDAGFDDIKIEKIKVSANFESAEDFWDKMVRGNAPITLMKKSLPSREWKKRNKKAISFLQKNLEGQDFHLYAWLATAKKN